MTLARMSGCVKRARGLPEYVHTTSTLAQAVRGIHAKKTEAAFFFLKCLDPGSGRTIPVIWHGAGANLGVFIPET